MDRNEIINDDDDVVTMDVDDIPSVAGDDSHEKKGIKLVFEGLFQQFDPCKNEQEEDGKTDLHFWAKNNSVVGFPLIESDDISERSNYVNATDSTGKRQLSMPLNPVPVKPLTKFMHFLIFQLIH